MSKRTIKNSLEGYNIYAPLYDSTLAHLDSFEKDELVKLVGSVKNKRVLDLGCGTGRIIQILKRRADAAADAPGVAQTLQASRAHKRELPPSSASFSSAGAAGAHSAGAHFTGVDISEEMLRIAKKHHPDVDIVHADMTDLPLEDDTFDIVIAAFVIVHIKDKDLTKVFDEVARVLKPGGTFILTNINQRKAPKLTLNTRKKLIIKSYYHIPKHVIKKLEDSLFKIEKEIFVNEGNTWINQIIRATISK